jgi:hypothetical protein
MATVETVKVMNESFASCDLPRNTFYAGGADKPIFKTTGKPGGIEASVVNASGATVTPQSTDGRGASFELTLPITRASGVFVDIENVLKWRRSAKEDRQPTQTVKLLLDPTDPMLASSLAGLETFKKFAFDGAIDAWYKAGYAPSSALKKHLKDEDKYKEILSCAFSDTGQSPFGVVSEEDDKWVATFRSKFAPYDGETTSKNKEIVHAYDPSSEVARFAEENPATRLQFVELIRVDGTVVGPEDYQEACETMFQKDSLVIATIGVWFGGVHTFKGDMSKQSFKPALRSLQAVEIPDPNARSSSKGRPNLLDALAAYDLKRDAPEEEPAEQPDEKKKAKKQKKEKAVN